MTTRVTGTYADIYDWENLYSAYRKAAKGKRGKRAAASFEFKMEDNLWALHDELANETYETQPPSNSRVGAYSEGVPTVACSL